MQFERRTLPLSVTPHVEQKENKRQYKKIIDQHGQHIG